jgi:hypothetical protein
VLDVVAVVVVVVVLVVNEYESGGETGTVPLIEQC